MTIFFLLFSPENPLDLDNFIAARQKSLPASSAGRYLLIAVHENDHKDKIKQVSNHCVLFQRNLAKISTVRRHLQDIKKPWSKEANISNACLLKTKFKWIAKLSGTAPVTWLAAWDKEESF